MRSRRWFGSYPWSSRRRAITDIAWSHFARPKPDTYTAVGSPYNFQIEGGTPTDPPLTGGTPPGHG